MMFRINYSNQSRKFLKKIDRALAGRIIGKIEKLMDAFISIQALPRITR
jgi:hypothetical protein